MSNQLLTIDGAKNSMKQITTGLQTFEEKKQEVEQIVKDASQLNITGVNDKEGLKKVEEARKKLKALRIEAEKTGKGMRDLITPISKHISEKEKELTSIIEPEEQRLLSIEKWVEKEKENIRLEKERIEAEKLQKKVDAFSQYGYAVDIASIMSWSDDQYNTELSKAKTEYEVEQARIEAEKIEQERLRKEEQERIEKEKAQLEVERKELEAKRKEQEEAERKLKEEQAKVDAEKQRIENEKKAQEERKKREAEKEEEEKLRKLEEERIAALAPKKEKLEQWVSSFELPASPIGMAEDKAVVEIITKFEAFKNWAAAKVENLK